MSQRERAIHTINHKEVFPVPVDVFENGIYPKLENGLREHFELSPASQLSPTDRDDLLEALGACSRRAQPFFIGPPPIKENKNLAVAWPHRRAVINIWGTWDGPESYTDQLERPLAKAETKLDIDHHQWPTPEWFDYNKVGVPLYQPEISEDLKHWSERKSNYLRIAGGWSPIASRVFDLFGMQVGLTNMVARPLLVETTLSHISDFYEEYYNRLAKSAQGFFDILAFGDDFASQKSMLFSPVFWRRYFLPIWKKLFAIAHNRGFKTLLHSCGSIRPIIPDLVNIGLDILEVVQITANRMDPVELKREFGKDLVFYGGMDLQKIMPYSTPADVRLETRRLIDLFSKNGGYIFETSHFMMDDVPVENVLAMYEESNSYIPGFGSRN